MAHLTTKIVVNCATNHFKIISLHHLYPHATYSYQNLCYSPFYLIISTEFLSIASIFASKVSTVPTHLSEYTGHCPSMYHRGINPKTPLRIHSHGDTPLSPTHSESASLLPHVGLAPSTASYAILSSNPLRFFSLSGWRPIRIKINQIPEIHNCIPGIFLFLSLYGL